MPPWFVVRIVWLIRRKAKTQYDLHNTIYRITEKEMKSDHRHELKTNELAEWLGNLPQWTKENLVTIIIAVEDRKSVV